MRNILFLVWCLVAPVLSAMAAPTVFALHGRVADEHGRGIAGVVVNNGIAFTTTDGRGRWQLSTDTALCKFVSISTPAEFELPQRRGLARFYVSVGEAVAKGRADFVLRRRSRVDERFHYLAISDPQVRNADEMGRWKDETCADLKATADSLSQTAEVVSVALGDLVFDHMELFSGYADSYASMPLTAFQCIGNHDFDKRYQSLHAMPYGSPVYAEREYERWFGPVNYSFNVGRVHVVTLNSIDYIGQKRYTESLTGATLEWLRRDLSFVPKGTVVFLNMHAAGWNSVEGEGNVRNAGALAEVLRGYRAHVFCGHTHFFENVMVTDSLYQHNIGAACGSWWSGEVNRCGAPNGYLVVDVDGDNVRWHYKATGRPVDYQLRVADRGVLEEWPDDVVANVWDYDSLTRVEWFQDGRPMGPMERFTGVAPSYARQLRPEASGCVTGHLFRARPQGEYKDIEVRFTNRFGEVFSQHAVRTRVVAHRGFWTCAGAAQNSVAALRAARRIQAYGSEFDVSITRDGVPVVNHDADVDGVKIATANYADIAQKRLANGEPLPRLADYLAAAVPLRGMRLVLEIKPHDSVADEDRCVDEVVSEVEAAGLASRVDYISFSLHVCERLAARVKEARVAYLGGDLEPEAVKAKGLTGIDYALKVLRAHPDWIDRARRLGLTVNVWTVDGVSDLADLVARKVDFVTTNRPVEALRLTF